MAPAARCWTDSGNSGAEESQTCRTISTAVLFCCGSRWKTLLAANSVTLASSVSAVTCQGSPQLYMSQGNQGRMDLRGGQAARRRALGAHTQPQHVVL